jgi:phosphotransferase system enzyme I (PtsI)
LTGSQELTGTGVSPGIAVGRALVVERQVRPALRLSLEPEQVEAEVARLARAVEASRRQLLAIKERLGRDVGLPHAYIFDAHLLMLEDPLLYERSLELVRGERVNAEWALRTVAEQLHGLFDEFSDGYLRERSSDVDDVLGRIALNLAGDDEAPTLSRLPGPVVLVADDLGPSEAGELDWPRVLAVAVDAGARTSHTVILARSLGIPAVVDLKDATRRIRAGATLAVDGTRGLVVVDPSGPAIERLRVVQEQERREELRLEATRGLPAVTRDGVTLRLRANVEFLEESQSVLRFGAEGIGLFRSEYLLGAGRRWPDEERQVDVYRRLLEQVRPEPVVVRTWDVGPEEFGPAGPSSPNPALGERALRLLHRDPRPFLTQLRALLRAAAHGPLSIMLPFVAGPHDLRLALELLDQARASLRRDGLAHAGSVPVGINVEIPSAALVADLLAREADFFAIGTNDLIQYLLAVDRTDPRVAPLYQALHPAVLRTIEAVVRAGDARGLPVSACGEMAAEPLTALALLGLGVREFSMTPGAIPRVKGVLRAADAGRAREVMQACLGLPDAAQVEARLRSEWRSAGAVAASAGRE